MFDLIANLLSFFYDINNSYVVAIVLLTFVVLVISTPLTLQGTKSMLRMQLLQPELKKIQDKYGKDEREKMNAELMEFYQENNINPVGGCLPLLFQIPVFLVLYRVILGLTRRATDLGSNTGSVFGSIGGSSEPAVFEATEAARFNPAFVSEDSQLFTDLAETNEMTSVGFDISRTAAEVVGDSIVDSLPYLLLVLVVGLSGWMQHRMIRSRQTGASINPTQEMIMKVMPIFLPVFSFTLPAAIVFYFLVSNLYRIAQQYYITRSFYSGDDSLGGQLRSRREQGPEDGEGGGKGSGKDGGGGGKGSGKGGGPKNNGSGGAKNPNAKNKNPNNKSNGKSKGGGNKNSKSAGKGGKSKSSTATRTKAPGRNSSGRSASARAQVQPKARKKKKR